MNKTIEQLEAMLAALNAEGTEMAEFRSYALKSRLWEIKTLQSYLSSLPADHPFHPDNYQGDFNNGDLALMYDLVVPQEEEHPEISDWLGFAQDVPLKPEVQKFLDDFNQASRELAEELNRPIVDRDPGDETDADV